MRWKTVFVGCIAATWLISLEGQSGQEKQPARQKASEGATESEVAGKEAPADTEETKKTSPGKATRVRRSAKAKSSPSKSKRPERQEKDSAGRRTKEEKERSEIEGRVRRALKGRKNDIYVIQLYKSEVRVSPNTDTQIIGAAPKLQRQMARSASVIICDGKEQAVKEVAEFMIGASRPVATSETRSVLDKEDYERIGSTVFRYRHFRDQDIPVQVNPGEANFKVLKTFPATDAGRLAAARLRTSMVGPSTGSDK